jgi:hypothetical protein
MVFSHIPDDDVHFIVEIYTVLLRLKRDNIFMSLCDSRSEALIILSF